MSGHQRLLADRKYDFIQETGDRTEVAPDKQRRVRSHAQKDYRRRHPSRRQSTSFELDASRLLHATNVSTISTRFNDPMLEPRINTFIDASRSDPFTAFNVDNSRRAQRLWDHVYDGSCAKFRALNGIGFLDLVRETIALPQLLAASAWHLVHFLRCDPERREDMQYSLQTTQSLQNKLGDHMSSMSREVIIAVLACAAYANLIKNVNLFEMHISGLRNILQLKGDETLSNSDDIVKLAIFWVETNGCFIADRSPHFIQPYQCLAAKSQLAFPLPALNVLTEVEENLEDVSKSIITARLQNMLLDVNRAISLQLQTTKDFWHDVMFSVFNLSPIMHSILTMGRSTVNDTTIRKRMECLRVGCMLYIANLRFKFDPDPGVGKMYGLKLKAILDSPFMLPKWSTSNHLLLWVLTVAASSACLDESMKRDFILHLSESLKIGGIVHMCDLLSAIRNFAWCDEAFQEELNTLLIQLIRNNSI